MNSELYQQILRENIRTYVQELNLERKWVMCAWGHCITRSRSTKEVLKNKVNVFEWPSQNPDLNLIEILWKELKQAVHRREPNNIAELRWFPTEEWAKIPTSRCAGLISSYKKHLPAVIDAKRGHTRYWKQRFTYFCHWQILYVRL